MTLNRFYLYVEAAGRLKGRDRQNTVVDLTASIQIALAGKGLEKYLKELRGDG